MHHASNPRYLDANYGGVTIIFDRLFGTHIKETSEEKIVYGLVTPLFSINPFKIAFHEWMGILKDTKAFYNRPAVLWGYLFGKPGWSHDGSRKDSKKLREEYFAGPAPQAKE